MAPAGRRAVPGGCLLVRREPRPRGPGALPLQQRQPRGPRQGGESARPCAERRRRHGPDHGCGPRGRHGHDPLGHAGHGLVLALPPQAGRGCPSGWRIPRGPGGLSPDRRGGGRGRCPPVGGDGHRGDGRPAPRSVDGHHGGPAGPHGPHLLGLGPGGRRLRGAQADAPRRGRRVGSDVACEAQHGEGRHHVPGGSGADGFAAGRMDRTR